MSASSSFSSPSLQSGEIQEVQANLGGPSRSVSDEMEQPRSEAGPLPVKRGEIGYSESVNKETETGDSSSMIATPEAPQSSGNNNGDTATVSAQPSIDSSASPNARASTPETASTHSKKSVLSFFKSKKLPSYFGIRLSDLIKLTIQLLIATGTIACWVLAAMAITKANKGSNDGSNTNNIPGTSGNASSSIFIHVLFGISLLVQLIFLERTIFHIRAQRWMHLHPGEILPTAYRNRAQDTRIPIAPWDRPPIPTYAAALAESGVGTGDAEDNVIAVPPPPAYGNTRGSRLLLTGFLNQTQREQRPQSVHSQMSQSSERPVSYRSHDEEWEVIRDAERAVTLERTLATLEEGSNRPNGTA